MDEDRDKALEFFSKLTPEQRRKLEEDISLHPIIGKALWIPNPGPQTDAYYSKADILLYGGSGGSGKALSIDTELPTPYGWVRMDEVAIGDLLFDDTGNVCSVIGATPVMFGHTCYCITFSDGEKIVADADHQWLTQTCKDRDYGKRRTHEARAKRRGVRQSRAKESPQRTWTIPHLVKSNKYRDYNYKEPSVGSVKTTKEIAESLFFGKRNSKNHSVLVADPIINEDADLPIDPYIFGMWIGDGSSYKAEITTADQEIVLACASNDYVVSKRGKYAYGINGGLLVELRKLGVLGNKHIPNKYLRGSVKQRLALLQGVMDTDGTCDKNGYCSFCSTKKSVSSGVLELIRSLGIKATETVGYAKLNGRVVSKKYGIKFSTSLQVFRIPRKLIRQKRSGFNGTNKRRYITSVDKIDSVPVRCIEVDSASHLYLAGRSMIPTHNSDLGLGLAFNEHKRSLILRRRYSDIGALVERAIEINGTRSGYNGTPPPILRTVNEKYIQFGANQHPGDEANWQGRPYDLKVFDETCHFTRAQITFHLGWLRSTDPNQRCRVILPTNPPVSADGDWVIGMFRPWLDITHPNPAEAGELRWFITSPDGEEIEKPYEELNRDETGRHFCELDGRKVFASSKTFIPAKLKDNPFLINTNYQARLDALPEPLRSAIRDGNFMLGRQDAEWQLIPTQWILEAQSRWKPDGWRGEAMTAIAIDPAGGGKDSAELIWRYGNWFAEPISKRGEETADGSSAAATILKYRRDNAAIIVEVGGGWGGQITMRLTDNDVPFDVFQPSEMTSLKTKDRQLRFANKRAEAWWRMKEALDPDQEGGSPIALPPSPELRSDLAAMTYRVGARGITMEDKDLLRKRLGRSTGKGDACVMCNYVGLKVARRAYLRGTGADPRLGGLPRFAKRREGPLTRRRTN